MANQCHHWLHQLFLYIRHRMSMYVRDISRLPFKWRFSCFHVLFCFWNCAYFFNVFIVDDLTDDPRPLVVGVTRLSRFRIYRILWSNPDSPGMVSLVWMKPFLLSYKCQPSCVTSGFAPTCTVVTPWFYWSTARSSVQPSHYYTASQLSSWTQRQNYIWS